MINMFVLCHFYTPNNIHKILTPAFDFVTLYKPGLVDQKSSIASFCVPNLMYFL